MTVRTDYILYSSLAVEAYGSGTVSLGGNLASIGIGRKVVGFVSQSDKPSSYA